MTAPQLKAQGQLKAGGSNNGNNRTFLRGSWKADEDAVLRRCVESLGTRSWTEVAAMLNAHLGRADGSGRSGKQCRERWGHHLRPDIRTGAWTEEEDLVIIAAHKSLGNKWRQIAKLLTGRTEEAVKNHWNSTVRQKLEERPGPQQQRQGDRWQGPSLLKQYILSLGLQPRKRSGTDDRANSSRDGVNSGCVSGGSVPSSEDNRLNCDGGDGEDSTDESAEEGNEQGGKRCEHRRYGQGLRDSGPSSSDNARQGVSVTDSAGAAEVAAAAVEVATRVTASEDRPPETRECRGRVADGEAAVQGPGQPIVTQLAPLHASAALRPLATPTFVAIQAAAVEAGVTAAGSQATGTAVPGYGEAAPMAGHPASAMAAAAAAAAAAALRRPPMLPYDFAAGMGALGAMGMMSLGMMPPGFMVTATSPLPLLMMPPPPPTVVARAEAEVAAGATVPTVVQQHPLPSSVAARPDYSSASFAALVQASAGADGSGDRGHAGVNDGSRSPKRRRLLARQQQQQPDQQGQQQAAPLNMPAAALNPALVATAAAMHPTLALTSYMMSSSAAAYFLEMQKAAAAAAAAASTGTAALGPPNHLFAMQTQPPQLPFQPGHGPESIQAFQELQVAQAMEETSRGVQGRSDERDSENSSLSQQQQVQQALPSPGERVFGVKEVRTAEEPSALGAAVLWEQEPSSSPLVCRDLDGTSRPKHGHINVASAQVTLQSPPGGLAAVRPASLRGECNSGGSVDAVCTTDAGRPCAENFPSSVAAAAPQSVFSMEGTRGATSAIPTDLRNRSSGTETASVRSSPPPGGMLFMPSLQHQQQTSFNNDCNPSQANCMNNGDQQNNHQETTNYQHVLDGVGPSYDPLDDRNLDNLLVPDRLQAPKPATKDQQNAVLQLHFYEPPQPMGDMAEVVSATEQATAAITGAVARMPRPPHCLCNKRGSCSLAAPGAVASLTTTATAGGVSSGQHEALLAALPFFCRASQDMVIGAHSTQLEAAALVSTAGQQHTAAASLLGQTAASAVPRGQPPPVTAAMHIASAPPQEGDIVRCDAREVGPRGSSGEECGGVPVSAEAAGGGSGSNSIKRIWSDAESRALAELVATFGEGKWCRVARELNLRFSQQVADADAFGCHHHYHHATGSGAGGCGGSGGSGSADGSTGRRTAKQCRERWLHHLKPDISKKSWSEEEEWALVVAHSKIGNRWADIARKLGAGRSENTVKNHWNSALRRKQLWRYEDMRISVLDCYQVLHGFKTLPAEAQGEVLAATAGKGRQLPVPCSSNRNGGGASGGGGSENGSGSNRSGEKKRRGVKDRDNATGTTATASVAGGLAVSGEADTHTNAAAPRLFTTMPALLPSSSVIIAEPQQPPQLSPADSQSIVLGDGAVSIHAKPGYSSDFSATVAGRNERISEKRSRHLQDQYQQPQLHQQGLEIPQLELHPHASLSQPTHLPVGALAAAGVTFPQGPTDAIDGQQLPQPHHQLPHLQQGAAAASPSAVLSAGASATPTAAGVPTPTRPVSILPTPPTSTSTPTPTTMMASAAVVLAAGASPPPFQPLLVETCAQEVAAAVAAAAAQHHRQHRHQVGPLMTPAEAIAAVTAAAAASVAAGPPPLQVQHRQGTVSPGAPNPEMSLPPVSLQQPQQQQTQSQTALLQQPPLLTMQEQLQQQQLLLQQHLAQLMAAHAAANVHGAGTPEGGGSVPLVATVPAGATTAAIVAATQLTPASATASNNVVAAGITSCNTDPGEEHCMLDFFA